MVISGFFLDVIQLVTSRRIYGSVTETKDK